jgi:dephospho-CoA kinase
VPLLIEVGWQERVDEIWLVSLDRKTQINRLIKRDGLTLKDAQIRIDNQILLEEKKKYAKVIIDNSQGLEKTREQVIFNYTKTYNFLK